MASTPQTSASYSSTSPAISSAYQRIGGATPIISYTGTSGAGPKLKSIKDSLMEREKAKREVDEALNPWKKPFREQNEEMTQLLLQAQKLGRQQDQDLMNRMTAFYGNTPEAQGAYLAAKDRADVEWQRRAMEAQKRRY